MKDRISLIAAAAGGFMLSIAVASIINAAPITSLKSPPTVETRHGASLQQPVSPDQPVDYTLNHKSKREFLAFWNSFRIAD